MGKTVIVTSEERAKIIDLYVNEYKAIHKIAEDFDFGSRVVKRVLLEEGVELRKKTCKYHSKTDMFKQIDSYEKAYWLGFIAADGCVFKRANCNSDTLSINLSRKDRDHLEKFRDFMQSNVQIIDHVQTAGFSASAEKGGSAMSKIAINSHDLVMDLIALNIVPNKSLILQPPKIDDEYAKSFILGYFDGDGSLAKLKTGLYSMSIQGTQEMLEWIKIHLEMEETPLEKRHPDSDKNSFYIRCGGTNKPYEKMSILYNVDSECEKYCLTRKKAIYNELQTVVLARNSK